MRPTGDPLSLSREDLYELVWSKPMTELAKDFGLSDVALAKRCRKLGVPVPGRGYWARIAAGQAPRQRPLRTRAESAMDYTALTFNPPREESLESATPHEPGQHPVRERLQTLQITPNEDLRNGSPAVKRTAVRLKRPWRNEITWNRGERKGPIVSVDVTELVVDRALLVFERVITGAAAVGWTFGAPPPEESESRSYRHNYEEHPEELTFGCIYVHGEPFALRLDERRKQVDHVLTDTERARQRRGEHIYPPRWDHTPTGELRLHASAAHSRHPLRTWRDRVKQRLEDQVNAILVALLDEALSIKAERERQRLAEIERRREETQRWEQSERRTANTKLVHELEAQAGAWMRARFLRSYLRALRRAIGKQTLEAKHQDDAIDFLAWAQHYIDQLDPLCVTPHDPDLKAERSGYYSSPETKVNETLSRLLGRHWQDAFKVGLAASESPPSAASALFGNNERYRPPVYVRP